MIVTAYIDESGTHDSASFMIMGGYVGRLGQWTTFNAKWPKLLKKHGLEYFHSKELWARKKREYKNWSDDYALNFTRKAGALTEKNTMMGFSVRLDDVDFKNHYLGDRLKGVHFDSKYGLCFRCCLAFIPECVVKELNREDVQINFVLENNTSFGDALRVFQQVKTIPEIGKYLGECIAGEKRGHYGLQAADAMASFAWKAEAMTDLNLVVDFPNELSLEEARKATKLRSPLLRVHADSGRLKLMRENLIALKNFKKEFGEKRNKEIAERKKSASS